MFELGKLFLPHTLFYYPSRRHITLRNPELFGHPYEGECECSLDLQFQGTRVFIDYYCDTLEADDFLSEKLGFFRLVFGDLQEESFRSIQERALRFISVYVMDPAELEDYFNAIWDE